MKTLFGLSRSDKYRAAVKKAADKFGGMSGEELVRFAENVTGSFREQYGWGFICGELVQPEYWGSLDFQAQHEPVRGYSPVSGSNFVECSYSPVVVAANDDIYGKWHKYHLEVRSDFELLMAA